MDPQLVHFRQIFTDLTILAVQVESAHEKTNN